MLADLIDSGHGNSFAFKVPKYKGENIQGSQRREPPIYFRGIEPFPQTSTNKQNTRIGC